MTYFIYLSDDQSGEASRLAGDLKLPDNFNIPICESCDGHMTAVVLLADPNISRTPLLVFQCQNEPGLCEEWEADSGGNKVVAIENVELEPQPGAKALVFQPCDISDEKLQSSDETDSYFDLATQSNYEYLVGKALGEPIWYQAEETPDCCQQKMTFVAQIDECEDLNFGGSGVGYIFECTKCQGCKFLTQC